MNTNHPVYAEKHASRETNLSASALKKWHDKLEGPRDSSGRRLYTSELIEQIRKKRSS